MQLRATDTAPVVAALSTLMITARSVVSFVCRSGAQAADEGRVNRTGSGASGFSMLINTLQDEGNVMTFGTVSLQPPPHSCMRSVSDV